MYGGLTEHMSVRPNTAVALSRLIQPKLSLEPGDYQDADILAAIGEVAPAFEIADCRWQGWAFARQCGVPPGVCGRALR